MKDNRRDFIKKSASLAAALSVGGVNVGMAHPLVPKEKPDKGKAFAKDAGMKFALAMGPDSPRVPFAKQIDVMHAVSGIIKDPNLKPWEPEAIKATRAAWEKEG
jgi:mannonate dehydratase